MFCWPRTIVYQCSDTNVMNFVFSLLRIKGLYMFWALHAHSEEALHKRHLVYCLRVMSVVFTRVGVPQSAVCVILNKLNTKCITLVSLYWFLRFICAWYLRLQSAAVPWSTLNMHRCEAYTSTCIVCGDGLKSCIRTLSNVVDDEEEKYLIFVYLIVSQT
jgi:hypothetical protein